MPSVGIKKYLIFSVVFLLVLIVSIIGLRSFLNKKTVILAPNPFPTRYKNDLKNTSSYAKRSNDQSSVQSSENFQQKENSFQTQLPIQHENFAIDYSERLDKYVVSTNNELGSESYNEWLNNNEPFKQFLSEQRTIISPQTKLELHTALNTVSENSIPVSPKKESTEVNSFFKLFNMLLNLPFLLPADTLTGVTPTVTKSQIQPTQFQSPSPSGKCLDLDKIMSDYSLPFKDGSAGFPRTSNQIFDSTQTKNYSIPYRNTTCSVSETRIKLAYEKIKSFYPGYWSNSQLLEHWQLVQEKAKQYGFNPLFLISLWLEESAAGGAQQATQFGCDFLHNANGTWTQLRGKGTSDICDQLQCIFAIVTSDPQDYPRFACNYNYGGDYCIATDKSVCGKCKKDPVFVRTVEFWYSFLSVDQPDECKPKYCPGIEGC